MIGLNFNSTFNPKPIEQAQEKAAYRSHSHAAASIRKEMIASIETSPKPAPSGEPPRTRGRKKIRRSILYAATKENAVVGTARSRFGTAGEPHEHGGDYKGQHYEKRPFALPALEKNLSRFAESWRGTIGG